uniref:paraquat-inducible protein A n=1 Tax=Inquilinus sp. OTU3971 TaxID=3043855 RepID=UPI00313B5E63
MTALILYIPANLLRVMTVISLGSGAPDTIMSGVIELADAGMWPLAVLVFFASFTVPVLKLVG